MSRRPLLGRRAVLGGAGAAIALPALEAMAGRPGPPPRRFVAVFTPNGTIHDRWRPTGTEDDFTMSPMMAPLEPHKRHLVVLEGIYLKHANGEGHTDGMGAALTGMPLLPTRNGTGFASGISVDQVLAARIGLQTRFRSLEIIPRPTTPNVWGCLAYAGSNQPVPPEGDPAALFDRLFGDGDAAAAADVRRRRTSVLDAVKESHAALARRLGRADRHKVEAHLAAVRDIERRLAVVTNAAPTPACARPGAPAPTDHWNERARLQMDLMILALACDQTRVATFMYDHAASRVRATWLGVEDEYHQAFHDGKYHVVEKIWTWYASEMAYLLSRLEGTPDGDRTLLDSTLVFWTSEQSDGRRHRHNNMPFMLAGRAGGALRTGRYLRYEGNPPHNDLLVSLLNLMGVPARTFGRPDWCTGPLPRLTDGSASGA